MTRWILSLAILMLALALSTTAASGEPEASPSDPAHPADEARSVEPSHAGERGGSTAPSHAGAMHHNDSITSAHEAEPAPVLPSEEHGTGRDHHGLTWPGVVLIVILGMFFAAAFIGPIVRAHAPEEIPPVHSHDEPPGASHHHGQSGTVNPEPDHGDSHGAHH